MKLKRILVPVDFSRTSLQALDHAADLAAPFKAEIVGLFVVEPVIYATPGDLYGAASNLGMVMKDQERYGRQQLVRLQRRMARKIPRLRTVLLTGTPYVAIVEAAKKLKADLIVMSTHGRTGLAHLLMGSVAEKVVRSAPCPVLTVRGRLRSARRAPARSRRAGKK